MQEVKSFSRDQARYPAMGYPLLSLQLYIREHQVKRVVAYSQEEEKEKILIF